MLTMERRITINEAAELLDRRPATLRDWERRPGLLPVELHSSRNERGWRYWTPEQIDGIRKWMRDNDMRPGKGLPHYKPDAAAVHSHLQGQRRSRGRVAA